MIGLLDLTEHDRQALLRVAAGRLVWFPFIPQEWGPDWRLPRGTSAWVWLDGAAGHPSEMASGDLVTSVYRLQHAGLLGLTQPFSQVLPSRAGARLIHALDSDGWQPPDRAPLAIAATVRKATRPRKKRAS